MRRQFQLWSWVSILILAPACATTSRRPVPSNVAEAEQAVAEARASAAGRVLPRSLGRAQRALAESHALLDRSAAASAGSAQAKELERAAVKKADEAGQLALSAHDLGLKIAAWDGRIEDYADEQTSGRLLQLMAAEVTAACVASADAPGESDDGPAGAEGARGGSPLDGGSLQGTEFVSPVAFFAPGADALREQDLPHIASLAELLLQDPTLKVRLVGHPDDASDIRTGGSGKALGQATGQSPGQSSDHTAGQAAQGGAAAGVTGDPQGAATSLALRRARAVASALVEAGIRPARIEVGHEDEEDDGLGGGTSEGERQLDRRVEAHVTGGSPEDAEGFVP